MLFVVGGIVALGNLNPQVIAAPSVKVDWMVSHLHFHFQHQQKDTNGKKLQTSHLETEISYLAQRLFFFSFSFLSL